MLKIFPSAVSRVIFIALCILCVTPLVEAPLALAAGFLCTLLLGNPYKKFTAKIIQRLLKYSVVGLGFGMNIHEALKAGSEGLLFTLSSIFFTLAAGLLLGKVFKIDKKIATLVSAGTAICGGSAIAALTPVIGADEHESSVSLGVIFLLNSVALFLFPVLGHFLGMSQHQFGLWCAIAIHDTSSVVGAAAKFGDEALKVATAVKLERALWIIPISFLFAFRNKNSGKGSVKIPYFIFAFVLAIIINSYIPQIHAYSAVITYLAKRGLTLTLFLIGAGLSINSLKSVGTRPLILSIILWILVSAGSFYAIMK